MKTYRQVEESWLEEGSDQWWLSFWLPKRGSSKTIPEEMYSRPWRLNNFKLVANVPFLGKVLKWVVSDQIQAHMGETFSGKISTRFQAWLWHRNCLGRPIWWPGSGKGWGECNLADSPWTLSSSPPWQMLMHQPWYVSYKTVWAAGGGNHFAVAFTPCWKAGSIRWCLGDTFHPIGFSIVEFYRGQSCPPYYSIPTWNHWVLGCFVISLLITPNPVSIFCR